MPRPKFPKGVSGNPKGRPPLSPQQKALRLLTISSYKEVIETALNGTVDDLKALAINPATPAIQVAVATSILRAIKDGDPSVIELFASRIVGKIPDKLEVTSQTQTVVQVNVAMIREALVQLESDN